ncbi:Cupredoxin superfamily protein [Klebsormidium nitens]|uniref:Cupredoxin superfamily protein n=1 Tax=Klebsormidium nitens TaxID=105231 RepID=A0A1Y1I2K7_KLENI|nr:Cupredoxin superfamily protein [Klebsormidium nitens]|eukprot:GAQ82976.1 Cupredoxin superfamily protein [Klebsormidium nitens]
MSEQEDAFTWSRALPTAQLAFSGESAASEGCSARKRDRLTGADLSSPLAEQGQIPWEDQFLNVAPQEWPEQEGALLFAEQGGGDFPADAADLPPAKMQTGRSAGQPPQSTPSGIFLGAFSSISSVGDRASVGGKDVAGDASPSPPHSLATVLPNPGRREPLVLTTEEIQLAYKESWGWGGRPKPRPLEVAPVAPQPAKIDVVEGSSRDTGATKVQAAAIIRELFRRPRGVPVEQAPAGGGANAQFQDPPSEHGGASSQESWMGTGGSVSGSGSAIGAEAGGVPSRAEQIETDEAPLGVGPLPGSYAPRKPAPQRSGSERNRGVIASEQEAPLFDKNVERRKRAAGASGSNTLDGMSAEPASSTPEGGSGNSSEPAEEVTSLALAIELASCQVALATSITDLDVGLPLYDPQKARGSHPDVSVGLAAEKGLEDWVSGDPVVAGFEWLLEADPVPGEEPERGTSFDGRRAAETLSQTPKLHRLWADLSPSEVRRPQFRPFREAYKEELRRLRIWTATYAGPAIIPRVAELHYLACNALPGLGDRHTRMMLTKGALWTAFVRHSLGRASPADLYFACHDGQRVYRGESGPWLLSKLSPAMQDQCRTMCFLMEDLKDEAAYGPETFRAYQGLHKSGGVDLPPPRRGWAYRQVSFPELETPPISWPAAVDALCTEMEGLETGPVERIEFEGDPVFNEVCFTPMGLAARWGSFWHNRGPLLAAARGLAAAGERARHRVADLAERAMDGHVARFDAMAAGGSSGSVEKFLEYARDEAGWRVSLALAFCAVGQSLADAGRWEPTADGVNALFGETGRGLELAANVVQITSDLRTYQADLSQARLNAVAVCMREQDCGHSQAVAHLTARAAADLSLLAQELVARAPGGDLFARKCWRLVFDLCRTAATLVTYTAAESGGSRHENLFETG